MTIRVVLVDDQELVRLGFRMVLDAQPGIDVVGEADDGDTALELLRAQEADIALVDVRMPRMNGVEATRRIRAEDGPRVLILTTFDLDEYAYEALRAGASGFLLKDAPLADLVSALNHVHFGDAVVAPSTTRRLLEHFVERGTAGLQPHPAPAELDELTHREHEVLVLLARGLSNAEIADELVVSEGTVKTHVKRILTKLDLRDRVQAVVLAYESGVVEAGRR
ncbi:response regulator [Actinopolyspora saharensis]|uniref:DNA-binding response regulator, NarL/FixJ family, contains REC and HTH domains n=1 Tax=Actinopolyspora saharensis TaxID=995062 RepID=A0A1H0YYV7_9ACTN|nr:response regulator transcription factor [Actinopolyspora saharensis]SDQ20278.1 DNA-binding response regulator, NarL/FixJ family, contains REC and HTH domains [Actinopolyspora saharensis]